MAASGERGCTGALAARAAPPRRKEARPVIFAIDLTHCTRCGLCDPVCPADVIHIEEPDGEPVIRFREHCVTCFNCEIFCPTSCINVHPVVHPRPLPW
jgi:ferredoxin